MSSVNVYIKENVAGIAKKDVYIAPEIPEKKLNNVIKAYNCENYQNSILAIYDNTLLGSAKEGLVFTGEKLLYNNGNLIEFFYKDINSVEYVKDTVVDNRGKEEIEHYIIIKVNDESYKLDKLGTFNYQNFVVLLNAIINDFDEYKEEDQLKTIADMPDKFKEAYLKIIVNMTYIDDDEIDEKEFAEILLLMTRLELSQNSRFELRSYITKIAHENLVSIEDLILTIKEHSESSHFQSFMISLAKDLINVYFTTNDKINRDFKFLIDNQSLFNLSDKEIDLAFSAVENDYKILKENLDDNAIKKNAEDLATKAASAGAPLAAVYISGSVIGMSASGITSGLATLGMGMGMTGGLVVVGLIGIVTYKGLKHITGANELDKYKTRELMLHEVIKQTQKTISLIIEDINFVIQKLNDLQLTQNDLEVDNENIKNLLIQKNAENKKFMKMLNLSQNALNIVDYKVDKYQNSLNQLQCPRELDVSRLKSLTSEPMKKPLFDFIINNYEEKTAEIKGKERKSVMLKENIDTEVLDKMGEVFKSIGYFNMENIVTGKTLEGVAKIKKGLLG